MPLTLLSYRSNDVLIMNAQAQLTVEQFQLNDILAEFDPPSYIRNQIENGLLTQREGDDVEDGNEEAFLGEDPYAPMADVVHSKVPGKQIDQLSSGEGVSLQLHVDSTGLSSGGDGDNLSYGAGGPSDMIVAFPPVDQGLREVMAERNGTRLRLYAEMYSELGGGEAPPRLLSEADEVARSVLVGPGRNRTFVMSVPAISGSAQSITQSGVLKRKLTRIPDTSARIIPSSQYQIAPSLEDGKVDGEHISVLKEGVDVGDSEDRGASEAATALDDIDDTEINTFILSTAEQKKRTAIWERMHRGYIDEREARRIQKENESGKKTKRPEPPKNNVASAVASIMGGHGKRARTASGAVVAGDDCAEVEAGQKHQSSVAFIKKSKKINFNALQSVMNFDDGKFMQPRRLAPPGVKQKDGQLKPLHPSSYYNYLIYICRLFETSGGTVVSSGSIVALPRQSRRRGLIGTTASQAQI
jgi:hypothetical protein